MAAFLDTCRFNPTLGGTTDWTYSSAVTGYNSPALAGVVNARVYKYRAEDSTNTQWEMGEGSYNTSTGVLTRTTVLFNSSGTGTASGQSGAGTKITFSTVPQVAIVALKEDLLSIEEANTFTATQQQQAQVNIAAAPFDAIAFNGMQVNGGCEVSQENGTSTLTLTASGSLQTIDLMDGIKAHYRGTFVVTSAQADVVSGAIAFGNAQKMISILVTTQQTTLGANDELSVVLPMEGYRVARLGFGGSAAMPSSVGFWIRTGTSLAIGGSLRNSAKNRSLPFSFNTVAATPTWISLTNLLGDTSGTWLRDNGVGLYVTICLAAGNLRCGTAGTWATSDLSSATGTNSVLSVNNTFKISNILVVPGIQLPSATYAYNAMRSFDQEFTLTQRYYQSIAPGVTSAEFITGGMASAIQGYYPIRLNGVMRAIPTCSVSAASDWNNNPFVNLASIQPGTSAQFAGQSTFGFRLGITSASTGVPSPFGQLSVLDAVNTSAKIIADARL